jgi:hypothetical protein
MSRPVHPPPSGAISSTCTCAFKFSYTLTLFCGSSKHHPAN